MKAMRETSNQSIIVIEHIDCNAEVLEFDRSKQDKHSDSVLGAKVCYLTPSQSHIKIFYK